MRCHEDAEACAPHSLLVHSVRDAYARLYVSLVSIPRRAIAAVSESVSAEHLELRGRENEVRRVCVKGCGVGSTRSRINRTRSVQIESALNAVVALRQRSLQFIAHAQVQRDLRRQSPVVLNEEAVIVRLNGVGYRVIYLAGG